MGDQKGWIVKDSEGRLRGPYGTQAILDKIAGGEFTGEEQIATYPGGHWIPISSDPQFYDHLLEALYGQANEADDWADEDPSAHLSFDPEDPLKRPSERSGRPKKSKSKTSSSQSSDWDPEKTQVHVETMDEDTQPRVERVEFNDEESTSSHSVIELKSMTSLVRSEVKKRAFIPAVLIGLLLVGSVYFFMQEDSVYEDRIHLMAPRAQAPEMSAQQVSQHVQWGVSEFLKDTYSSYVKAQNHLVQAIEGDPKNTEVLALLCLTYWELWPYAVQDSHDLKIISDSAQRASSLDITGADGATCRVVDLFVRNRMGEAKSLVSAKLDDQNESEKPPILLYYLKAYLLASFGEPETAISYAQSAQQLWPQWIRAYSLEARLQAQVGQVEEAANIYAKILKANPQHKEAIIELGLLEYREFRHPQKAEELLQAAMTSKEKAPKGVLSAGYMGLAEIELKKNSQSQALDYAQQAYSLNSSNMAAKNLIVKLGGMEKLKKTEIKSQQLVYEGDQFVREGDCNAAQAHYKTAYDMDKKNAVAAMKAGQCLWDLSFSTEAIEWMNKAIKADPNLIEAYVILSDYYTQRFNFLAAAKILGVAQRVAPKSYEVFRGYALVELRRKNPEGALDYGKRALELYATDVESHIIMAQACLEMNDYRQAYALAAKATEIDINNREAQVIYGQALAGIQGVDVGTNYMMELVNKYPLVSEYRLALGQILQEDERYAEAAEVFQQIVDIKEKPREAYLELGRVLKAQGNAKEALNAFLEAAVLDPADAEPLFEAGLLYLSVDKPDEARVQFERVLRINKRWPLVHYYIGQAELKKKNYKEAINQAELERQMNPNLADAYLLKAEAYSKLKQYSLCGREYQKAIQLRPQGAEIYVKVAKCYRLSGSLDVALSMLEHAASKESGLSDIYKEQGAIYEMKGDIDLAIEAYSQYFILDPNAPDRELIEARIRNLQRSPSGE